MPSDALYISVSGRCLSFSILRSTDNCASLNSVESKYGFCNDPTLEFLFVATLGPRKDRFDDHGRLNDYRQTSRTRSSIPE